MYQKKRINLYLYLVVSLQVIPILMRGYTVFKSYKSDSEIYDSTIIGVKKKRLAAGRKALSKKTYKKSGKITFTTEYNKENKTLEIHILRAFGVGSRCDVADTHPFVRLYLTPGKKQKQNTGYQKATRDPFFNEKIVMTDLAQEDLVKYKLKLKVYNHGRLKKDEILGEVDLALSSIDAHQKETFAVDLFRIRSGVSCSVP